jgi:hypothetical protein
MPPYEGPITIKSPATFPEVTSPEGKFFTLSVAERISWANLVARMATDLDVVDILLAVSGNDRLPVSAVLGASKLVDVATRNDLPTEGGKHTLYLVADDGGKRSILFYQDGDYRDYSGSSASGLPITSSLPTSGDWQRVEAEYTGTRPSLSGAGGTYFLSFAGGSDLRVLRLFTRSETEGQSGADLVTNSSGKLSLTVENGNGGRTYLRPMLLQEGETIFDLAAAGVRHYQRPHPTAANQTIHEFSSLGTAADSFTLILTRC